MKKIGQGSFRSIPFLIVDDAEQSGGQRIIQHDYPLRDIGRVQNMGKKAEQYSINVVLNGKKMLKQRDEFVKALQDSTAGELEHPNFETILVYIMEWRQIISTKTQGSIYFTLTYVAADEDDESPVTQINGEKSLLDQVEGAIDSVLDEINSIFDEIEEFTSMISDTINFASNIANKITNTIRRITNITGLSSILGSAMGFKASISDLFHAPSKVFSELKTLFGAFKELKGGQSNNALNSIRKANNTITPPNDKAKALQVAINALILTTQSQIILSDAIKAVKSKTKQQEINGSSVLTLEDCKQSILEHGKLLQESKIELSDLHFYQSAKSIRKVRQIFIEQMQLISEKLPNSSMITTSTTEPALVTLYREQGECLQINRFVRRNGIHHPSFLVGGQSYEVIDDINR